MKRFVLLCVTLALVLCLGSCGRNADGGSANTSTPVALPEGYLYDVGGMSKCTYDDKDRITERVSYDFLGKVVSTTTFTYEADGVTIREVEGAYVSESFNIPGKGLKYTISSLPDYSVRYDYTDGEQSKATYYDKSGTPLTESRYRNGAVYYKATYKNGVLDLGTEYDENGRQVKSVNYTTKGEVNTYNVYTYDDKGHNTRMDMYDSKDALMLYTVYKYNSAGSYEEVVTYDSEDCITGRSCYEYDESGKQTGLLKYTYKDGNAVSYEKFVIDEKGNSVSQGVYDA